MDTRFSGSGISIYDGIIGARTIRVHDTTIKLLVYEKVVTENLARAARLRPTVVVKGINGNKSRIFGVSFPYRTNQV
jgi:hypothetical protein